MFASSRSDANSVERPTREKVASTQQVAPRLMTQQATSCEVSRTLTDNHSRNFSSNHSKHLPDNSTSCKHTYPSLVRKPKLRGIEGIVATMARRSSSPQRSRSSNNEPSTRPRSTASPPAPTFDRRSPTISTPHTLRVNVDDSMVPLVVVWLMSSELECVVCPMRDAIGASWPAAWFAEVDVTVETDVDRLTPPYGTERNDSETILVR